jgi:hypothetical protein
MGLGCMWDAGGEDNDALRGLTVPRGRLGLDSESQGCNSEEACRSR